MTDPPAGPPTIAAPSDAPDASAAKPKARKSQRRIETILGILLLLIALAIGIVVLWAYFGIGGLFKKAFPDPTPPPARQLPLALDVFNVVRDVRYTCREQMDQLIGLSSCDAAKTFRGEEIACFLSPPWRRLHFGCGPTPRERNLPKLTLKPSRGQDATWLREQAETWLGPCRVEAVGPAADQPQRWPGDTGQKVCFFAGGFESAGRLDRSYPLGIYLTLDLRRPEVANALIFEPNERFDREAQILYYAMMERFFEALSDKDSAYPGL